MLGHTPITKLFPQSNLKVLNCREELEVRASNVSRSRRSLNIVQLHLHAQVLCSPEGFDKMVEQELCKK